MIAKYTAKLQQKSKSLQQETAFSCKRKIKKVQPEKVAPKFTTWGYPYFTSTFLTATFPPGDSTMTT